VPLNGRIPAVYKLAEHAFAGRQADAGPAALAVDGSSFGLSFALAQASELLDWPLPKDLAASAKLLNENGMLGEIGGIFQKIGALTRSAPRVKRLLVAPGNAIEASDAVNAAGVTIEIIQVTSFSEALDLAFGPLDKHLRAAARDPMRRRDILDGLCELVWSERPGVSDWRRIASTAKEILDAVGEATWSLTGDERQALEFAGAVAQRHAANRGSVALPDPQHLAAMPEPRRSQYVAHILQQVADTACCDAGRTLGIAEGMVPLTPADRHPGHLMLLGAQARLWAVRGNFGGAMDLARETTLAWLQRRLYAEAARPLCVWLRLAGALGRTESFEEAVDTAAMVRRRVRLDHPEYLQLAQAHGQCSFPLRSSQQSEQAAELSRVLVEQAEHVHRQPVEVALSARRLLLQVTDRQSVLAAAQRQVLASSTETLAKVFGCLADIDAGEGDPVELLRRLQTHGGGPIVHLAAACPEQDPWARANWLARWYPY
jgi:hypothetical protein